MARHSLDEDEDHNSDDEEEEEEEEALSLCDLPIVVINGENNQQSSETRSLEVEEFEFGSWAGSLLTESEMCAADDVFFQGQILPLRLSVSSDNGLTVTRQDSRNPSRCGSRSESMDHCSSTGGFTSTSVSSRSSSSRSSTSTTTGTTTTTTYKPKVRNQFHSHPSPKPQVLFSGSRPGNVSNRSRKSTIWGLFRVGLVRTPEIELQDLKLRNNKSFNSTSSSSSSSCSKKSNNEGKLEEKKKKTQRFLFEGCKCSVGAVETVSSRIVIIKSINNNNKKKVNGREIKEEEKEKTEKQGKKALYHRRTFEWLKELSIVDVPDY